MQKFAFFLFFVLALSFSATAHASSVAISAADIYPRLYRGEFNRIVSNNVPITESKTDYLNRYQFVYVTIENSTGKPINVNPGYFTLASSAKKSYSFTADMYGLKNEMPWVGMKPIAATKVLPGTSVEGFLMFERSMKNEWPVSLYFESPETSGSIPVKLDPEATYE